MQKVAESFRSKVGTKDFTILRTVAETAANRDGTHLKPWEQERLTWPRGLLPRNPFLKL